MDCYNFFKGKHVLITGGAGFIGSHFCENLILGGSHIIVLDNFTTGHNVLSVPHDMKEGSSSIVYIRGDILDDDSYAKVDRYLDANKAKLSLVVHLAAAISVAESMTDPEKYHRVNVLGSKKVYDYCISHSVPTVISATSAAVYGDCGDSAIDESFPYGGVSPYAKSKYDMEELTRDYQKAYSHNKDSKAHSELKNNVHFINCRFFNVYGPRQDPSSPYTGVMSVFFANAKAGKTVNIYGDGDQSRDFIFVGDIVNGALSLAMKNLEHDAASVPLKGLAKVDSNVYNLGTGKICTINELAKVVIAISNSSSDIKHSAARAGDIYFSCSNPDAAFKKCGWKAKVDLKNGMKLVWNWFRVSGENKLDEKGENKLMADSKNTFKHISKSLSIESY